jgi:hypothetical protein
MVFSHFHMGRGPMDDKVCAETTGMQFGGSAGGFLVGGHNPGYRATNNYTVLSKIKQVGDTTERGWHQQPLATGSNHRFNSCPWMGF